MKLNRIPFSTSLRMMSVIINSRGMDIHVAISPSNVTSLSIVKGRYLVQMVVK